MYLLKRVFKQKTFLLVLIQSIFASKLSFRNIFVDSKYLIFPPTRLVTITTHNSYKDNEQFLGKAKRSYFVFCKRVTTHVLFFVLKTQSRCTIVTVMIAGIIDTDRSTSTKTESIKSHFCNWNWGQDETTKLYHKWSFIWKKIVMTEINIWYDRYTVYRA